MNLDLADIRSVFNCLACSSFSRERGLVYSLGKGSFRSKRREQKVPGRLEKQGVQVAWSTET